MKSVVGCNGDSAGVVRKRHNGDTWLDVYKAGPFDQMAGRQVNLLIDIPPSDMFVAIGLGIMTCLPNAQNEITSRENGTDVGHVLARHTRTSDMAYIFIVGTEAKILSEVILGLCYVRVRKASMGKNFSD